MAYGKISKPKKTKHQRDMITIKLKIPIGQIITAEIKKQILMELESDEMKSERVFIKLEDEESEDLPIKSE